MKARPIFILLLALFATLSAKAQNSIDVASFRLLDTDLTANLQGTKRIDQNGHTAALIKVVTTQTGFTFDVGVMGIVDTQQEPSEIWVWVPFGVRHLTIRHPQLGQLRDYYFPISIEEARTYELVLTTGKVKTIVEEDVGGAYLMMTVEPKSATVYIDEKLQLVENGQVMLMLPYGKHTYRVEAASFMNEAGIFEIGKERVELNIRLVSSKATLTVDCTDAEAGIYINDQEKGRGSWTGQLTDGMYVVEARKAGHRSVKQSLTLTKQEQKTLTLNAPEPIYGKLNLTSSPGNCDVYLDGTKIGKSPDIFSNILVGSHTVELYTEGYENTSKQITIEEGKTASLNIELKKGNGNALAQQAQQPNEATPDSILSFTVNGVTFKMIYVEGGTFTMGDKSTQNVTLSSFYMGETEVMQALWQAVMVGTTSINKNSNLPMICVSWNDCQDFINKLNQLCASQLNGWQFALPTEAEWEYAARGGKMTHHFKYSGSDKRKQVAWSWSPYPCFIPYVNLIYLWFPKPHAVGTKLPNELGLYDMSGNVWEWCQDWYSNYGSSALTNPTGPSFGSKRVIRGGSFLSRTRCNKVSYRKSIKPDKHKIDVGFRLSLH